MVSYLQEPKESPKFTLNWVDLKKIATGALIAIVGALLAYFADTVIPQLEGSGEALKLTIAAILMIVINTARKYLSGRDVDNVDNGDG